MQDITQYSNQELSLHFMNDELLYMAMTNASRWQQVEEIARDYFIFTSNQLYELRNDWEGNENE